MFTLWYTNHHYYLSLFGQYWCIHLRFLESSCFHTLKSNCLAQGYFFSARQEEQDISDRYVLYLGLLGQPRVTWAYHIKFNY